MGYVIRALILCGLTVWSATRAWGQSHDAQQLLLNVEKLSQLKNILSDMKKGYQIVSTGYNRVKDISKGNFSLHELFLDGLLLVSPEVRKYHKISGIINGQRQLVNTYRSALSDFRSGNFSAAELQYLSGVYGRLLSASLENLEELALVITSSKLRMNDEQRLRAIDRIYASVREKLLFLNEFNTEAELLHGQRRLERAELARGRRLFNLD